MLIDGGHGWLSHKRTYAINDLFQLQMYIGPYEHAQWCAPRNVLMIVASLYGSLCSAREGVK